MKRVLSITAALWLCCTMLCASNAARLRQLSINDGLSHYDVTDIVQDKYGFIWIGTHDGLNRYDGAEILSFRHDPEDPGSLGHNRVKSLNYDGTLEQLWVGMDGGGIDIYDYSTGTFAHLHLYGDRNPMLPENDILDIASEHDGRVWVATRVALLLLDRTHDAVQTIPYGSGPIFKQVVQYGDVMFMAFNTEVRRYLRTEQGYVQDAVIPIPSGRTNQLVVGPAGQMFVATRRALCYAENAMTSMSLRVLDLTKDIGGGKWNNFSSVVFDGAGPVVAVSGRGLFRLSGIQEHAKAVRLETDMPAFWKDNPLYDVKRDRSGNLWVSSTAKGVGIVNMIRQEFSHLPLGNQDDGSPLISALYWEKSGVLWAGTQKGGLYRVDNGGVEKHYNVINGPVSDVYAHGDSVWVCILGNVQHSGHPETSDSFRTVYSSDRNDENIPYLGYAYSVCEDRSGNLWIGCRRGVMRVRNGVADIVVPFDTQAPVKLYPDAGNAGRMWVSSTRGGVLCIDVDSYGQLDTVRHYRHVSGDPKSLSSDVVWSMCRTSTGTFYVGTDAGLCILNPETGTVSRVDEESMLHNCKVLAINEDSSSVLWVNTPHGLVRHDPHSGSEFLFNSRDGLSSGSMTTASAMTSGDVLFVGTNGGINYFSTSKVSPVRRDADVVVSGFRISSVPVHGGEKVYGHVVLRESILEADVVNLRHDQNDITFELSILFFEDQVRCRYAYRLEGYDDDWTVTDASQRLVSYSKLRPGTYHFEVASLPDGSSPERASRSIKVCVRPAPWASVPAYLGYSLTALALACYVYRRWKRQQRLKNEAMLQDVRRQMERKANENRIRFYANITHELRTPLTLVTAPLMELEARTDLPNDVQDKIAIMKRNGDRLMELVKQFLELSKIDSQSLPLSLSWSDCAALVTRVASRFDAIAERKKIDYSVSVGTGDMHGWVDPDKLSTILSNLLSNAFKFTPDSGGISVGLSREDDGMEFTVSDTGIGISAEDLPHIFERFFQSEKKSVSGTGIGLEMVKLLVEIHHGHISVESEPGKGSSFRVWLPCTDDGSDKSGLGGSVPSDKGAAVASNDMAVADGRKTILVVEDDDDMRAYIKSILDEIYNVHEAVDGVDGYEKSLELIPDLIISDMMMPRMSGSEFCRKLSEDERVSHIPVVMVSAKDAETEGLSSGAIDYILKPFVPQNLILKVGNLIRYWDSRNLEQVPQPTIREKIEHFQADREKAFLERACRIVEENISDGDFNVESLYKALAVSKTLLHNKMTALTGDSASAFIRNIRLDKAMEMLQSGRYTISETLYSVGFNSPSYFSKKFKERFGKLPSDFISQ